LEDIQVPEAYFARREREWSLADRVVVNSEFSRQALLQQGVPPEKLVVIPLCYEANNETTGLRDYGTTGPEDGKAGSRKQKVEIGNRKSGVSGQKSVVSGQWSSGLRGASPLRVLFLGQVILRKGIQYLLAAARDLERENVRFDVVGSIGISRMAMATAPGNVTFHGRTGREQAAGWYRRSHLFVLPTLSDGFGITQLEAMAHGLPVIATPCCGKVVSDGVDGFIVPPRDAGALARTLQRYLAQPELLQAHRRAALEKSKQFTLERLAENLTRLEGELKNTKQK
jgi:glycosyltransferase involved in cell wall biosynthesis